MLRRFVSERGKIRSRRITGACRRHQSQLARAVKRARELARSLKALERGRTGGQAGGDEQGLGPGAHAQLAAIAFLANLSRVQLAQQGAMRQGRPVPGGGFQREEDKGSGISSELGGRHPRGYLPRRDQQGVEGQTNRLYPFA